MVMRLAFLGLPSLNAASALKAKNASKSQSKNKEHVRNEQNGVGGAA
jgi:hypothetical protein